MPRDPRKPVHVGAAWRVILRDLELDEAAILRRAGLPLTLFAGDGTHVSVDDFYALYDALEAEADEATIALRAGSVVSVELFDPALFAALCSPDMNTAATRLGQFKRMVGVFSLDVDIGREETRIRYRCKRRPDIPMILGLVEMVFLVAFARRATRHQIVPRRVTVQRLPSNLEPYQAYFGCPLERDETCAVSFAPADSKRPFLTHNARMWDSFEPSMRLRMLEASEAKSMRARVETALFELLPSGRTQIKHVGRALGVGSRTLQRRLAEEGTTWLEVLNHTRHRLAEHYLRTNMTPAEVSFLLGFEDPNSLFRAFQRWTGTTPEAWRANEHSTQGHDRLS